MRRTIAVLHGLALALLATLAACADRPADADWPLHGRTDEAQRYSPLEEIDRDNVDRLGLAWFHDLDTDRGQEATPIMVDGVLYLVSAYDVVQALDARTGELLWSY
ncbi:MAG: PQQ-binding-like beta-propeller repeat protein, partial [Erythrobacter sp.]|nr:PQQ-binding-like beta-propeller repeat protein [Erythrobacter sp.]